MVVPCSGLGVAGSLGNYLLYLIAVLINELHKEDSVQHRLHSIKKLSTIVLAFRVERIRTELLPPYTYNLWWRLIYVSSNKATGGRTWLCQWFAASFRKLKDHGRYPGLRQSGGVPAADFPGSGSSFCTTGEMPLSGNWFTSQTSLYVSCSAFTISGLQMLSKQKLDSTSIPCTQMNSDDTPMLWRSAASKLSKFANVLELGSLKSEIVPLFTNLASDEQHSVCPLTVKVCVTTATFRLWLCTHFSREQKIIYGCWQVCFQSSRKLWAPKLPWVTSTPAFHSLFKDWS